MDTGRPHCTDQQMEQFFNEQLGPADRSAFEEHLEECPACQQAMMACAAQPQEWREARDALQAAVVDDAANGLSLSVSPDAGGSGDEVRTGMEAVLRSLAPTDDPRMLGRIGPFEVQGVIGSGGMGVVLKGFDPALNRTVAIKVLAPHLAVSGSARRRFAREARAAAAVVHENVVAIHSVAEAGGLPYFVMPYIRGTSLERRLHERGPLGVTEILRIAWQTAAGLAAAHAQGLVHRDVKPANILLEDGVERLLLTDFGLARAVDDASLTRTGVIAGTPQYMSPEQARGETIDARSDLFSLGSVMYAMGTGRPPFRAETSYGILRRITDTEPRPIRDVNPEIPDWLVAIIAKLHAKDPARRFASAREVAELLEGCLAHLQQPASVPLPAALVTPAARRASSVRKTLVKGTMAMFATLVIALLGIMAVQTTESPDIAGHWSGEGWGQVVLTQTAAGAYAGTYSDTGGKTPGKIQLKWSRIERRFNGTWREGQDRFGRLSVRLANREIRGALTTDPKSKIKPAAARLADLVWTRVDAVTGEVPPTLGPTQDGPANLVRTEYDIGPLLAGEGNSGEPEDVIDLITSVICPEAWDKVGGPGTIAANKEKHLSILQTPAMHAQVAKLLEVLGKMPALQPQSAAKQPPKHYAVTEGKADADLSTVVYDVTDLVPTDDYDSLVRAFVDVEPSSWEDVGGPGCCVAFPQAKALVIVQTGTVHRQLQHGLRLYRQKPSAFGSFGPPAQADPHEQLRQRISLSLEAVPLPKALAQLAVQMRTNIVLDEESIRKAGIDMGAPVTIHVQVPERGSAVLKLILQPRRLGYTVEGRSIRVTTPENVETALYVRVYSVGDLLAPAAGEAPRDKDHAADPNAGPLPQKPRHDFRSLISLITGAVEPPSWDGVGGPGKIEPFEARSTLVITQTQPVHEQIADLLDELRHPLARQPSEPAESPAQQQPKGDAGGAGGFFSTDAGFPRSAVTAISAVTAVPNSRVAPQQDHVRLVALRQAVAQELPMQRLPKLGHSCGGLWYLPDGKTLLSTFGGIEQLPGRPVPNEDPRVGQVTFWDTSTWETKAVLGTGARRLIRGASLAISPDGSRLAVLAENQFVAVWNISSSPMPEKPVWEDAWDGGRNATRWVHCVAFSPDGAWIASLQSRRSSPTTRTCEYPLVFYDATSGRPEHEVELRVPSGHEVVFAPDGKRTAVTVSPARQKYLLQVVDATQRKIVKGVDLDEPIYHLRYSPDGRFLAACTRGSVWLFNTQTFQRRLLGQHPTRVPVGYFGTVAISALAMSHDGRLLATGGHEARPTVRVWDLRTGRLAHILQHPAGHDVYGLAFSPDGSQLVSGVNWDEDGQGAVCVWELPMRSVSELDVRN